MRISVVTTLYYSARYIEAFYSRTTATVSQLTSDFEIVLVNDGSPDESLEVAIELFERDPRVRILDLSRNFGHHKAMMTGLANARGDFVFLLDSDLEEEPELLLRFWDEMQATGADVIYGVQETRKGGWLEQVSGNLFYSIFNFISSVSVPKNVLAARLMTRRYVDSLVRHEDREVFALGLWTITGYRQIPVVVQKHSKGATSYNLKRKISILVNSITSFSSQPLVFIFYLGCIILAASSTAALALIVRRVLFGVLLSGWPSLIISIWLLGGLMVFCIGVVGVYLAKVFSEVKRRPYTIIRDYYERVEPGGRYEPQLDPHTRQGLLQ